jgi:hypothetical protein
VGTYGVTASLDNPNYVAPSITGTLTINPGDFSTPLVTVTALHWQTIKLSRKKSTQVLDITYSGPLNPADAVNLNAYTMDSALFHKKRFQGYLIPVSFWPPSYNPATNTVQLRPILNVPKKTMQLTINGGLIRDAEGRAVDGNGDSQPGGSLVATLNRSGVISIARTMVETRAGRVTDLAIDAMTSGDFLPNRIGRATRRPRPLR